MILLAGAALGGAAFVWSGLYDISANRQHLQPVYTLLELTMHQSVRRRASDIAVPALDDATRIARGAACYRQVCAQCHGGPGRAPDEIGLSMQPLPGPLVDAAAKWKPAELYWITRHGIKMSGMPAWQHRLPDDDLWAIVAFMQRLPTLGTLAFRDAGAGISCTTRDARPAADALAAAAAVAAAPAHVADPARGRQASTQYACNACHRIPGVTGSDVSVGPPLAGFANRQTIAGAVANTPETLTRWIADPQSIDPLTTMPNLRVLPHDAQDIAAYLLTLK